MAGIHTVMTLVAACVQVDVGVGSGAGRPPHSESKMTTKDSRNPGLVSSLRLWLIMVFCTFLVCALALELAFRISPGHLPLWYRSSLAVHGIELFQPGILERTPIIGVPLPYVMSGKSVVEGAAPQGLQALGLVPSDANPDREKYPRVVFKFDNHGLPNPGNATRADVLLVGDSFAVGAGALYPAGLQVKLQDMAKGRVYNLGIPAIGPQREEFMLHTLGLRLLPRAVIWLFFSGNDVDEAGRLERLRNEGIGTYGQLFDSPHRPRSYAFDLVKRAAINGLRTSFGQHRKRPLGPFILVTNEGKVPLWFHPPYLRNLRYGEGHWLAHSGWGPTRRVLARTSAALSSKGIRMLLVYIPSKPEVYLPYVEKDALLLHEMASFDLKVPLAKSPEDLWRSTMDNHDSLEQVLAEFAREKGIDFLSLSPHFRAAARAGALCFLSADTHWNDVGQDFAAHPIVAWLNSTD